MSNYDCGQKKRDSQQYRTKALRQLEIPTSELWEPDWENQDQRVFFGSKASWATIIFGQQKLTFWTKK